MKESVVHLNIVRGACAGKINYLEECKRSQTVGVILFYFCARYYTRVRIKKRVHNFCTTL